MADKPSSRKPRESKPNDASSYVNEKGERHFSFGKSGKTRDDGDFIPEKRPAYKGKSEGRGEKPGRDAQERKPYSKRSAESNGNPGYAPKTDSDKPFRKGRKSEGEGGAERGPFKEKFSENKPFRKSKFDGGSEEKPYRKSNSEGGGYGDKPFRKPKTEEGSYSRRRESGSDDKPYRKSKFEGNAEEKPYRKSGSEGGGYGDKPFRKPKTEEGSYSRRREGGSDDKPFRKGKSDSFADKRGPKPSRFDKSAPGTGKPPRFEKRGESGKDSFGTGRGKARKYDDLPTDGEWLDPSEFSAELGKARKSTRGKNSEAGYRPDFIPRDDKPRRPRVKKETLEDKDGKVRLNKYIANAGICSRREADDLIISGAIRVNGQIVTQLGYRVDPTDKVQYGDQTLSRETKRYLLLNKPKDYITTANDPEGRKTVMELVSDACRERLYPVGRLDRATTGLLLMTNDGELAKKLMHPSHNVRKVYHVVLSKNLQAIDLKKITEGVVLEDGKAEVDEIAWASSDNKKEVGVVLHSGKNRIVRRIFEHLGYEVVKLDRTGFAGLTKKNLPRGKFRFLTDKEVSLLHMM